jgi:hypothetical protein
MVTKIYIFFKRHNNINLTDETREVGQHLYFTDIPKHNKNPD